MLNLVRFLSGPDTIRPLNAAAEQFEYVAQTDKKLEFPAGVWRWPSRSNLHRMHPVIRCKGSSNSA